MSQLKQYRDLEFDKTRPLFTHQRCNKCSFEWVAHGNKCEKCDYILVVFKLPKGSLIGDMKITPTPPHRIDDGEGGHEMCSCWDCSKALRKVTRCKHKFFETCEGGATGCIACSHLYTTWLNYTPPRYYWAP